MDPLRSDTRPAEALTGNERDARIEQLLLAGLDQYFAHHYEHAINLWTRVLFLDRGHDRARAYIERARSAQAEQQRESEAVLHQGIKAFHDGDVAAARRLIVDALDRGASRDEAEGMLDRIERLGAGQTAPRARRRMATLATHDAAADDARARPGRSRGWIAAALLVAAGIGALAVGAWGVAIPEPAAWRLFNGATFNEARVAAPIALAALPLPGPTESFLARARTLAATGRLHDATIELARVPLGDPLRVDADRLLAEIQRQLLAVAAAEHPPTPPAKLSPVRPPE